MRRIALLLALALSSPAWADNTADEADVAFDLGNRAYAKRDYPGALASYFLSYRLVPNRNVLFNIARCYEALDKPDEAYRYWNDLWVDPSLPESDKGDVKAALKRLAPKVALVTVTSTPAGAELYVDRKDLGSRGRTPQTIAVTPGAHTLLLELPGYQPGSAKVATARGKETKQAVELARIVGTVTLTGTPAGAVVRETADGPELGKLPATLTFPPGQRLLLVQAPGYLPQQVLVDVQANGEVAAKVALAEKPKPTGKVVVTANRANAAVSVDGRQSGFTPTVLTLPVGTHRVEVTADDVTPLVQEVKVVADGEVRIDAELRYAPPQVGAASKSLLSVDDAPASVTVITREELQAFGYQTLTEALQVVRGFFLTDDRVYTYIGVRGFQPPGDLNTRILVLWDGHPTSDVWAGQNFAARDLDVDLSAIERIEVVRGPASLLFGTGAFFGVVNVVPRATVGRGRNVEGVVGAGGQNAVKARAFASLGQEGKNLSVTGAALFSEGAPLTDFGGGRVVQGLDGERSLGVSMRGEIAGLTLVAKLQQRRKQAPSAPLGAAFGVPGTEYTDARGFAELRYQKDFGRVQLNARGAYDASRYRGYFAQLDDEGNRVRPSETGGADWFSGELRVGVTLFEGNRLTASFESQGQFVTQQPIGLGPQPRTRVLFAGTLLDEWKITSWLFVQGGLRVDKYLDLGDVALSPRGAVVARFYQGGLTKLVAGSAFRAPTIYEAYYTDGNMTQRAPFTPPRPELITTFEGEHSHDLTRELRVTVGGYYNLIDRLVVLTEDTLETPLCGVDGEALQCVVYGNSPGRVTAGGAEAQLRWQPGRFTLVDVGYSFVMLGGQDAATASFPMHLASVRALVPLKEGLVRLSGQGLYQSARLASDGTRIGEALLLNVGLSGEYGPVRYFAGVQNLLDQRYSLPVLSEVSFGRVPQYGRTFMLEVAASF